MVYIFFMLENFKSNPDAGLRLPALAPSTNPQNGSSFKFQLFMMASAFQFFSISASSFSAFYHIRGACFSRLLTHKIFPMIFLRAVYVPRRIALWGVLPIAGLPNLAQTPLAHECSNAILLGFEASREES